MVMGAVPLDILLDDLRTMLPPEVEAIRKGAREIVYSGATRIRTMSLEMEMTPEQAAQVLKACNQILTADCGPCDPNGPNYTGGSSTPNHVIRFRGPLCAP